MSDLGQTRTLDNVRVASVKLLMADSKRTFSSVRSGPFSDKALQQNSALPTGADRRLSIFSAVHNRRLLGNTISRPKS
jgi:hypothetical protein